MLLAVCFAQGGPGEGFDVQKYGDGRVALIGEQQQQQQQQAASSSTNQLV
jgi:ribosome-interacting GTPase 1